MPLTILRNLSRSFAVLFSKTIEPVFLGKSRWHSAYWHKFRPSAFVVRPSQSEGLECLKRGLTMIAKFTGTSTPTYSTATLDMTSITTCCRKLSRKKLSKLPLPTASSRISREGFKRGSRNFKGSSGTIVLTNLQDITSIAASSLLQNAMKYWTRVRKTGAVGQGVE